MGKLTVRAIESAKPKDSPYKLMDGNGLQLRVSVDGSKTWLVRYFVEGKEKQYRLPGDYRSEGGAGFNTLAEARLDAARIRELGRQGIDHAVALADDLAAKAREKDREQAKRQAESLTVSALFDEWIVTTDRKDKGAELRRLFTRDVLPAIGAKPVKEITERHMRGILDAVVKRGANRMAVMLLSDLKQMFRWAEKRRPWKPLIEDNPVEHLEGKKITTADYDGAERTRTLSNAEIKELAIKLPAAGLLRRTEICMWVMLSCCCRIGEVIKARWEHMDLDAGVWRIPKENAKNKVEHSIYLSAFTLPYFRELKQLAGDSAWCFPRDDDSSHVCMKSATKQVRDRQLAATDRKPMKNRSRATDALLLASGDWVPHDLRRTGATLMQSLGVVPEVIERCLNHVEPDKLRRTYQTYDYAKEKREAWRLLGDRLNLLINPSSNVVLLEAVNVS